MIVFRWTLPSLLALAVAVACSSERSHRTEPAATLEPATCGGIARLHRHDGVLLASQPSPDDFARARADGVETVVDLRHAGEHDLDEEAVVTGLGMTYLNPAWNGPDELTDDVFDELREVLATAERPILLHCGSANRVGAVWLAHRALDHGLSDEEALDEARVVGLKTPAYEAKALDYVARRRAR